jgi:hypothetical protein
VRDGFADHSIGSLLGADVSQSVARALALPWCPCAPPKLH